MEPRVERALRELSDALAGSALVSRVLKAREDVEGREATRIMLRDLENLQGEIFQKVGRGEAVPQALEARYRQVAEHASYNPYLRELLQAEAELAETLDEIQRAILQAAGLAPAPAEGGGSSTDSGAGDPARGAERVPSQGGQQQRPAVNPVRSKLWVPGQGQP